MLHRHTEMLLPGASTHTLLAAACLLLLFHALLRCCVAMTASRLSILNRQLTCQPASQPAGQAGMTSAALSAWTTTIKELQQLLDGDPKGHASTAAKWNAFSAAINRLIEQPPWTRAAWKKLTQEVKVRADMLGCNWPGSCTAA